MRRSSILSKSPVHGLLAMASLRGWAGVGVGAGVWAAAAALVRNRTVRNGDLIALSPLKDCPDHFATRGRRGTPLLKSYGSVCAGIDQLISRSRQNAGRAPGRSYTPPQGQRRGRFPSVRRKRGSNGG